MISPKIISAHKTYHSVSRCRRGNQEVRSNSSKVNEAGVSALNIRLIGYYKELKTGERSKLKEEIKGAKVGTVGSKN